MRFLFLVAEAFRGLRRNATMTFAVVVTVAVSLAMLGASLMLRQEAHLMQGYWYGKVQVSVFLCHEQEPVGCARPVTTEESAAVKNRLETLPGVKHVYYEDAQTAYTHFVEQFKDNPELVNEVTVTDMPQAYRVALNSPSDTDAVIAAISEHPGVDVVSDHRKLLGPFLKVVGALQAVGLGVAAVLLVVAVVLVANTVRLSAMSRRKELAIMRLVGASKKGLMFPFLIEGMIAGLTGSALAAGTLLAVQRWVLEERLRPSMAGIPLIGYDHLWQLIPLLIAAGVGMVTLASGILLRRHLRA
jgi:cell division transport system permease protein